MSCKIDSHISVVIPVYNSEQILPELISRLSQELPNIASDYEVILVNDGSQDQSWNVIVDLASRHPWLKGINFMRNFGQHNAVLAGTRAAQYNLIVTMDDDLQHPPEEIPKLLAKLDEGYDVVFGTAEKHPQAFIRSLATFMIKWIMQHAIGVENARNMSSFRVFRAQVREAFSDYKNSYVAFDILLTWGTSNFGAVIVKHAPRFQGVSGYSVRKAINNTINAITGFTTLPLKFSSALGFIFMMFGVLLLVYLMGQFFMHGRSVPGFTFLAVTLVIFSGVQLFALGIIGEYLARIHLMSLGKPNSVIRNTIGFINGENQ